MLDDAKHSLGLKESQETSVKANEAQPHASGTEAANDLSAAKSAAMRAAEMGMFTSSFLFNI